MNISFQIYFYNYFTLFICFKCENKIKISNEIEVKLGYSKILLELFTFYNSACSSFHNLKIKN